MTQYGIEPTSITQVAIHTNFIYEVRTVDGLRFALRIHRQGDGGQDVHDPLDTKLECWWLQQLAADGFPVAEVVSNRSGDPITVVDAVEGVPGPQRCVLFRWLPGGPPDDEAQWYWIELGRIAARLHQQSASLTLPTWAKPRRWDSVLPYEKSHLEGGRSRGVLSPVQWDTLQRAASLMNPYLAAMYDQPRPARLIHGDLHDENVRSNRRRLSVFDFEDVILGHPEHDLAVALYGPYYNDPNVGEVVRGLRSGYEEAAHWPIDSLEDLRPLFAARAFGLVNFCLTLGANYLEYVAMLTDRVAAFVDDQGPL